MEQLSVNTGELTGAGTVVQTSMDAISAQVAHMMAHLQQLQGTWQGSAAIAFQDVVSRWQVTQLQVEETLAYIRLAMAQVAQEYENTELQVTAYFK